MADDGEPVRTRAQPGSAPSTARMKGGVVSTATSSPQLPAAPVHRGWMTLPWPAATALTVIWAAVIAISVFSPDLVSGTQQDHTPLAGILTWIWGLIATRTLITTLAAQRGHPDRVGDVAWLIAGVSVAWAAA